MKTSAILLVLLLFGMSNGIAGQGTQTTSVLKVLPAAESLGPGWERGVSLMFDPASSPAEMIGPTARIPDSLRREQMKVVENPTNRVSGWCNAHFVLPTTNKTFRYEVQVERYRDEQALTADFNELIALDLERYQKTIVPGVGEAAVIFRDPQGMGTLWFRRGHFRVWISPVRFPAALENDQQLQQLLKALDARLGADDPAGQAAPKSIESEKQ